MEVKRELLSGFECPVRHSHTERSGSDSMMDTPVPIPNTEVKHHNGDDSTLCENSKLPVLFFYFLHRLINPLKILEIII